MLHVYTTDGEIKKLAAAGPMEVILADVCVVIRKLWAVIREDNPGEGDVFQALIEEVMENGVIFENPEAADGSANVFFKVEATGDQTKGDG